MPKAGYVSPSGFKNMMTGGRGKNETFGKTALTYAQEIALERVGVHIDRDMYSKATQWGIDHEDEAIEAYEIKTMREVHSKQKFQQHPIYKQVGGTPDGLIGLNGGMDAKCPYVSANHMMNIIDSKQVKDYEYQLQGYMWITGREWWELVSYDPRFPDYLKLHIIRIERDEKIIKALEERYLLFEEIIEGYVSKLINKGVNK